MVVSNEAMKKTKQFCGREKVVGTTSFWILRDLIRYSGILRD